MLALALWPPTVLAVLAAFLLHRAPQPAEPTPPSTDARTLIALGPQEHDAVQAAMRRNVEAIDALLRAWSAKDRAGMAAALRRVPRHTPAMDAPSLRATLPPAWTALGQQLHTDLDALADDLEADLPDAEIPGRLATITASCVVCHRQFRTERVDGSIGQ
ncbi:MAG: hypothetical protein FJ090_07430 [Deltaproteobacteria bacterium]|nr:hypothetical protein [Deltaproteobacteria bacterium]